MQKLSFSFVHACTTRWEREKKEEEKKSMSTNNIIAITHPANRPPDRINIPLGSTARWVHLLVVVQS
jgi:hypothetical protein